jgi:hypothetical protein
MIIAAALIEGVALLAVVRNGIRKTTGQVLTYIKEVVMLEIGERAEVVTDKYCHYLTMA